MKILFLTHRVPYAPNRGDRLRAFHMLRVLSTRHEVHLVALAHEPEEEAHAADLRQVAASVTIARTTLAGKARRAVMGLAQDRPLTHALLDADGLQATLTRIVAARKPDLTLAYCSGMARFAIEPPLAGLPFVMDIVDVDSEKWAAYARQRNGALGAVYAREARLLSAFEARAALAASATLVVNERERTALRRIAPDAGIHVIPNGVDVETFRPTGTPSARPNVVFCGVMNYAPNTAAALWLTQTVWPRVRAVIPEATLTLVGASPPAQVRALAAPGLGVDVTGAVGDVRPYLWNAAVATAPLATARGVQNKVLEAVAAGLPCVTTSPVMEGLPPEVAPACVPADDADAFAAALVRLLRLAPLERRALARQARLERLGWTDRIAPLFPILEAAAGAVVRTGSTVWNADPLAARATRARA